MKLFDFVIIFSTMMNNTFDEKNFIMCLSNEASHRYKHTNPCDIYSHKLLKDCNSYIQNSTLTQKPCGTFGRIDEKMFEHTKLSFLNFLDKIYKNHQENPKSFNLYEDLYTNFLDHMVFI